MWAASWRTRRACAAATWPASTRFIEGIKAACFERDISYNLVNTKQPYDAFLAAYLEKRARLG